MDEHQKKLLGYIEVQLKKGVERDIIMKALADIGWPKERIDQAFSRFADPADVMPRPLQPAGPSGSKFSMANQKLIEHIKTQLQLGGSRENVTLVLLQHGWSLNHIDEAFGAISGSPAVPQPRFQPQPVFVQQPLRTEALILPGVTDLLGRAGQIFKSRWQVLLRISLISVLLNLSSTVLSFASNLQGTQVPITGLLITGLIIGLGRLTIFFLIMLNSAALIYAIVGSGDKISMLEAYRRGWKRIWSVAWVGFLAGLIVTGGMALFIIPGFIFTTWFSLAIWVLAAEDVRGMDALLKSKEYVRGIFGKVFGRLAFTFIIPLLAVLPLIFLVKGNSVVFLISSLAFSAIIGLFYTSFVSAYLFSLYKAVRALKGDVIYDNRAGKKALYISLGLGGSLLFFVTMIVIVVLAVLSPGPLLQQGRDSHRIADLATLESAISLYKSDVSGDPFCKDYLNYYSDQGTSAVDGTGWLPINFTKIFYGPGFSKLPVDPYNTSKYYYLFACDPATQTYELDAILESDKYNKTLDLPGSDGGNNPNVYEVGTNLNIVK